MKKTKKLSQPRELALFASTNPNASWNDFRSSNQGSDYKQTKLSAIKDQGGLCAYCEISFSQKPETFSIEHFHPKSDTSNPANNWALDWNNMLAVCKGGREDDKEIYPTPKNLSCDAYKDHLINKGSLHESCEGFLFNPLDMPTKNLFNFNKSNGKLCVNEEACRQIENPNTGQYEDVFQLAEKTLEILNLNCQRLCDHRLEVLKEYNRVIKRAREINNINIFDELTHRWFSKPWPQYFTVRRCLLGEKAERYLQEKQFDG